MFIYIPTYAYEQAIDDFDDALIEAREDVATLHLLDNLQILFDDAAKRLDEWFEKYNEQIKELPHDRQDVYRQIVALSTKPQDGVMALTVSRIEPTRVCEQNGAEKDIPSYKQHLLCDEAELYPSALKTWREADKSLCHQVLLFMLPNSGGCV